MDKAPKWYISEDRIELETTKPTPEWPAADIASATHAFCFGRIFTRNANGEWVLDKSEGDGPCEECGE